MLCKASCSLEEKIEKIRNRSHDEKMHRVGVPVLIGGKEIEIKPMGRGLARQWRECQLQGMQEVADLDENQDNALVKLWSLTEKNQTELLLLGIPELKGREKWLDEEALDDEIQEAIEILNAFAYPNLRGVTEQGTTSTKPTPLPSSPNSTQRTRSGKRKN